MQNMSALRPSVFLNGINRLLVIDFPTANNYQGQPQTSQSVSVLKPV